MKFIDVISAAISIDDKLIPNAYDLKNDLVESFLKDRHCPHHYFDKSVYHGESFCIEHVCQDCWDRDISH